MKLRSRLHVCQWAQVVLATMAPFKGWSLSVPQIMERLTVYWRKFEQLHVAKKYHHPPPYRGNPPPPRCVLLKDGERGGDGGVEDTQDASPLKVDGRLTALVKVDCRQLHWRQHDTRSTHARRTLSILLTHTLNTRSVTGDSTAHWARLTPNSRWAHD